MTTRQILCVIAAGAHLVMVATGAASLWLPAACGPIIKAEDAYRYASGTDSGYGFFAPGVQAPFRAVLEFHDAEGRSWSQVFGEGLNVETNLRVCSIPDSIPTLDAEPREALARSLAADALRRHPRAIEVLVRVDIFGIARADGSTDFPSMQEFRDGQRPQWLPLGSFAYQRRAGEPTASL